MAQLTIDVYIFVLVFEGDGYTCEPNDCRIVNFCDRNAQCVYDYENRQYACQCNDGFEGDGRTCSETGKRSLWHLSETNRVNNRRFIFKKEASVRFTIIKSECLNAFSNATAKVRNLLK